MKIRDLIDELTQYEFDSDQADQTDVKITLHVDEHTGSGFSIEKDISGVEISFGSTDQVEISLVLKREDMNHLKKNVQDFRR